MNNIDELKTILALTGPKRLPHLEAEIFADEDLTTLYLNNLCEGVDIWWISSDNSNAETAYWYAVEIIEGRWAEAESLIATDPQWAFYYAVDVINGRWPEAEPTISTNYNLTWHYAKRALHCRYSFAISAIIMQLKYALRRTNNYITNIWRKYVR